MYFFNKQEWLAALRQELRDINAEIYKARKEQNEFTRKRDFSLEIAQRLKELQTDHCYKSQEIENLRKSM